MADNNPAQDIKHVALNALHTSLGAKMVPFAGYNMPVRYTSDIAEHLCVRSAVGVFDVSHMGEIFVSGPDALTFLQYVTSNDVATLTNGKVQYSCLPNGDGGIIDDLLVYQRDVNDYMLVVNASNIDKDFGHLNAVVKDKGYKVTVANLSDNYSLFAVQGPKAVAALQALTQVALAKMAYYTFTTGTLAGIKDVIISATGYTGAGGFELYVPNANNAPEIVWQAIFKAGADFGIMPIGLGARDTLRLEMGFCLYGNDINDTTSPIEAGLGWITKFSKDFISKETFAAQKEAGATKKLVGFKLLDKGIPRQHYKVFDGTFTTEIGEVCSGSQSPSLGFGIGMAYLPSAYAKAGTAITIEVRGKYLAAEVVKLPFLPKA